MRHRSAVMSARLPVIAMAVCGLLAAMAPPVRAQALVLGAAERTGIASTDLTWVSEDPTTASIRMSRLAFGQADRVVIARDDAFADALASGPLQADAPLLLVDGQAGALREELIDELDRLGATQALVLGGEAAVGAAVIEDLARVGLTTRRIAGAGRIQTADEIAREAARDGAEAAILVRAGGPGSAGFADSLAAGALAAEQGLPILLTDTRTLAESTAQTLADVLDAGRAVYLIGGTSAISADVAAQVSSLGLEVTRVAGAGRAETAAAVQDLREALGGGDRDEAAVVLNGSRDNSWVAGFTSAAFAGSHAAPVVLTSASSIGVGSGLLGSRRPERLVCANNAGACAEAAALARMAPADLPGLPDAGTAAPGGTLSVDLSLLDPSQVTAEGDCLSAPTVVGLVSGVGRIRLSDDLTDGECSLSLRYATIGSATTAVTTLDITGRPGGATPDASDGVVFDELHVDGLAVPGVIDYATHVHGDPWDYDNAEDIILEDQISIGVTDRRLEDGMLKFSGALGYVHVLWQGFPGAIPIGRDGLASPIDTSTFRDVVVRVWISDRGQITLSQQRCDEDPGQCSDLAAQVVDGGWHTLRFPLDTSVPEIYGLRLGVAADQTVDVMVDWVRVVSADQPISLPPSAGPAPHQISGTGGVDGLTPAVSGGQVRANSVPAGEFTLTAADGTTTRLVVAEPPRLRFLNPDEAGGEDYITATTGDPWDFEQETDAAEVGFATDVDWSGGRLRATNTSNDPFVSLRMASTPLDTNRYHRITVTYANEGRWGLEDAPGGGAHGRVIWRRGTDYDNSAELVTYPAYSTYTFSMQHAEALEDDDIGTTWAGNPVDLIRIDPNEDPGARTWTVDEVAVRADDESHGSFTIELDEAASSFGGEELPATATIRLDTDQQGGDGVVVAEGVSLAAGTTGVPITTCALAPGTYWAHMTATRGPATYTAYSSGPLQVTNAAC